MPRDTWFGTLFLAIRSPKETLQTKVVVPRPGKADVLLMQGDKMDIVAAHNVAAPLLDGDVVVAPVPRVKVRASRHAKLEAHLRIAHEVAVLCAVVTNGDGWQSHRAGLVHRLDDQLHVGRVFDLEVQAVVPTSGLFEDCEDGLHYATRASSASGIVSATADDSSAARMTAEVCWMTSSDSASKDALP